MEEESVRAGARLKIRKTDSLTTEEMHNCNADNQAPDLVRAGDLGSVTHSNGGCSQEIKGRLRLGRGTVEELGKITKTKDVSLEAKAKTVRTLLCPVTRRGCASWTVKKAEREKWTHVKCGAGGALYGRPGPPKR